MGSPFKQLERYCLERKRTLLRQGINQLLKANRGSRYALHRSLDWYWRTGMNAEGLRLALPKSRRPISEVHGDPERILWIASFLVSLGAWPFAENILSNVRPRSIRQRLIAGLARAELGQPVQALKWLLRVAHPKQERRFLVHLGLATAFQRLGDFRNGLKWNELALRTFSEDPDRWLFECFRASFLCDAGKHKAALALLETADSRFATAPNLAPRYYAQTRGWKGRILASLGRKAEAEREFQLAEHHIRHGIPEYQPWRLLRLYHEMERAGLLKGQKKTDFARYPTREFFWPEAPDEDRKSSPRPLEIDLGRNEFRWNGRIQFGIPLEVRLIAQAFRAGSIGIHRNLLKCLLWEHELSNFLELDARLHKLRDRALSEYGIRVESHAEVIQIDPEDSGKISVRDSVERVPSALLEAPPEFNAAFVGRYYSLSPRRAATLLAEWEKAGWVARRGQKKGTKYSLKP